MKIALIGVSSETAQYCALPEARFNFPMVGGARDSMRTAAFRFVSNNVLNKMPQVLGHHKLYVDVAGLYLAKQVLKNADTATAFAQFEGFEQGRCLDIRPPSGGHTVRTHGT